MHLTTLYNAAVITKRIILAACVFLVLFLLHEGLSIALVVYTIGNVASSGPPLFAF